MHYSQEAKQGRRTGLQFGSSKNAFSGSNEAVDTGDPMLGSSEDVQQMQVLIDLKFLSIS